MVHTEHGNTPTLNGSPLCFSDRGSSVLQMLPHQVIWVTAKYPQVPCLKKKVLRWHTAEHYSWCNGLLSPCLTVAQNTVLCSERRSKTLNASRTNRQLITKSLMPLFENRFYVSVMKDMAFSGLWLRTFNPQQGQLSNTSSTLVTISASWFKWALGYGGHLSSCLQGMRRPTVYAAVTVNFTQSIGANAWGAGKVFSL